MAKNGKHRRSRKTLSSKVNNLSKKVNSIVKATETKTHEYTFTSIVSTSGDHVWLVEQIHNGTSAGQRIGDVITLKNLQLNFRVSIDPAGSLPDNINDMRILIIKTKYEASPILDNYLEDVSAGNFMLSPYKINPPNSYKILYDRKFANLGWQLGKSGDSTTPTVTVPRQVYRSVNINLKNMNQAYDFTTANPKEETLLLFLMSDSSVISHPKFDCYCRVRYQDL